MKRLRIMLAYWVVALTLFVPSAAYAYIDPATTTYLIQIMTALVVTVGVSLSIFLYKFRMISAKIKYGFFGFLYRIRKREPAAAGQARENKAETQACTFVYPAYAMPGEPYTPPKPGEEKLGIDGYRARLRTAFLPALALSLTFVLFACVDLFVQNLSDIPFVLSDLMPALAVFTAVFFAAMLFVIPLFRGRFYKIVLSIAIAILIFGYIQGNFLNRGLGELTGDAIDWSLYKPQMIYSVLCLIGVFALVFVLMFFVPSFRRILVLFVPILLVVIQGAGLVSLSAAGGGESEWTGAAFWRQADEYLTIEGLDKPAKKSAIVFVLDRFDHEYAEEMLNEDPDFFEPLDGFTQFSDNISYAASTFPSFAGMMTGNQYRWDQSDTDYFNYAWRNSDFINTLLEKGVDIRLYTDRGYVYNDIEQLRGIAGNIAEEKFPVSGRIALVKFLTLSAFRHAPMPLKQYFWISPGEFYDALSVSETNAPYIIDDFAFYENIRGGLDLSEAESSFICYHMLGPHGPLYMDENIQRVEWSTPIKQGMGAMKIVYEYLHQLKAMGLYEETTIIITGDHGDFVDGEFLNKPARTALFVKPAGSAGSPLARSDAPVCPDQLPATVMEGLFGETQGFGPGYLDVEDDTVLTRRYDFRRYKFQIEGDGRDFDNWEYMGEYSDEWESKVN